MKRLVLHIVLICFCTALYAQKIPAGQLKKADRLFENFEYANAAEAYQRVVEKAPDYEYAKSQLIKCYQKLNLTEQSLPLYAEIIRSGSATADESFKLAYIQALMKTANYNRAEGILQEVIDSNPENVKAQEFAKGLADMESFYLDSARYELTSFNFNSAEDDYAPSLFNQGVVFLSNRPDFEIIKSVNTWDNKGYYQQYYLPEGDSVELAKFDKRFEVKYHRGPVVFFKNDSSAIFTSNSKVKSKDGSFKLQLFLTEKDSNGKWSIPSAFPLNNPEHNFLSPHINASQDTLYFASDLPGGFGGYDIYLSTKTDSGWNEPINLGEAINTSGNDLYPYEQNGEFYFSSDSRYGLGGLDIYRISNEGEAINLGVPVNSSGDDFGLVLNPENKGYFASSRKGGMGGDDIYQLTIKEPVTELLIVDFVDEETGDAITGVNLVGLMDSEDFNFNTKNMDDGKLRLTLPLKHLFKLRFSKPDYITKEVDYESLSGDLTQVNLTVKMLKQLVISETVIDVEDGHPLDSVDVILTNLNTNSVDSLSTDENGYFDFNADRNTDYNVYLRRNGYFNYNKVVTTVPDSLGLILFNLSMEKINLGLGVEIADIYFELGSVELTPASKQNLDSLVNILQDNPRITIELGSHTDATGSSLFNLNISERRAIAVAEYLSSKGIDAKRLIAKGYGETEPINQCVDGVPCTKEELDVNRRLEFKVLSY